MRKIVVSPGFPLEVTMQARWEVTAGLPKPLTVQGPIAGGVRAQRGLPDFVAPCLRAQACSEWASSSLHGASSGPLAGQAPSAALTMLGQCRRNFYGEMEMKLASISWAAVLLRT